MERIAIRTGSVLDLRIVREGIDRFLNRFFGATEFRGGGDVVSNSGIFDAFLIGDALRAIITDTQPEIRVLWAGERLTAGAFIAPRVVWLGSVFVARDERSPPFNGVSTN